MELEGGAPGAATGVVAKRAEPEMFRMSTEPTACRRPAEAIGPALIREEVAPPRTLRYEVPFVPSSCSNGFQCSRAWIGDARKLF